ncbi:vacuolar protein sorting-associated protein 53 homolog isoform X2 [Gordionus sp. m RMFG-2023]
MNTEVEGLKTLEKAKSYIKDLSSQIIDIKSKAETSENMVNEITQDIRQLDQAKQNLTLSITTLNHLHMLVGGVESLEKLIPQRKYGEISNLFQGLLNVLDNFQGCTDIPQIKEMANKVQSLRKTVGQQIFDDFKNSMTGHGPRVLNTTHELYDAVRVIDIMDSSLKKEFLDWFINLQLAEYNVLFQETQDEGWLDKVDKRFTWFKRYGNDFTQKYYGVFPDNWHILSKIALHFCQITRNHLTKAMSQRYSEIDVKLILFAIQKTQVFENLLAEKFDTGDMEEDEEINIDGRDAKNPFNEPDISSSISAITRKPHTPHAISPKSSLTPVAGNEDKEHKLLKKKSPYIGAISKCFEDHLDIFIKAQDRNLKDMLDRFTRDTKALINELNATNSSNGNPFNAESDSALDPSSTAQNSLKESIVLPSSADLFVFYKSCLMQCAQINASRAMLNLANDVFKIYLKQYGNRVLLANVPNNPSSASSGTLSATASNLRELASFLKENTNKTLSRSEITLLCVFIGTAEYCCETIKQLETKMKEKIEPSLVDQVDFNDEIDLFQGIISTCINSLIQDLEAQCEPYLNAMSKTNWLNCESVGDQSKYVTGIVNCFKISFPFIKSNLTNSRKYFTQFCIRFVNSFIPKYLTALYKCKPVGMVGAEQLLLDTHSLKTVLLELPSLGAFNSNSSSLSVSNSYSNFSSLSNQGQGQSGINVKKLPPVSFTKIVVKGMTKAEMILKVVMTPHQDSVPLFVENCLKLLPDLEGIEFQKILDIKGIKRNEQYAIIDCFREHRANFQQNETENKISNSNSTSNASLPKEETPSSNQETVINGGNKNSNNIASTGTKALTSSLTSVASANESNKPSGNSLNSMIFSISDPRIKKIENLIKKKM